MPLTTDQTTAFHANAGFTPSAASTFVIGAVFAVLLIWGIWALRTAYVGWSEHRITQRQFLGVAMRFCAMYLVLTFLLLS